MTTASITPGSDVIGANSTYINVSLTPKNTLETTGKIIVYFPKWNPSDSSGAIID